MDRLDDLSDRDLSRLVYRLAYLNPELVAAELAAMDAAEADRSATAASLPLNTAIDQATAA